MRAAIAASAVGLISGACDGGGSSSPCGATEALVERVIDGDTIELAGGERIRYLMVNAPETTGGKNECYGTNATTFNEDLVLGKPVTLRHDAECEDRFARTLAYVTVSGQEVNRLLIERGYACLLHVPPNGDERAAEFEAYEAAARTGNRGVWGACDPVPCR